MGAANTPAVVAGDIAARGPAGHARAARPRPRLGGAAHMGAPSDLRRLWVERPGLGPTVPRHHRTLSRTDARRRDRGAADGHRATARRQVKWVRRAVAARPRRARARAVHQARHLRRDRRTPPSHSGASGSTTRSATPTAPRSRRWSPPTAGPARSGPARRSRPPRTPTRPTPRMSSGTRRPQACSHPCCTPPRSHACRSPTLVRWLDARDFSDAISLLETHGASAASDQLEGVDRRDERNRETTVMSALNLLRAYRHPQLTDTPASELTPTPFLTGKRARSTSSPPGTTRSCFARSSLRYSPPSTRRPSPAHASTGRYSRGCSS